ncbi:unnamed protein product [Arctia plantaginis]|uniref:CHK kinase-like domain-containing protein n=1 Tax=Arctia plantaginis TaxID=874455 RepID=A0A8S0YS09_ARCPL|nr:unnamed protein product [Arctia plantaginis]
MFENELFAYTDMLEKFIDLQEHANVKLQEQYKKVKMYKESSEEILVLENVAKKGFIINSRMEVPSSIFFQISVKELAKFHALSFVLKEKRPKYFNQKIKSIKYALFLKEGYARDSSRKASVNAVDEIFKNKVEKAYDLLMDKFCKYHNDESIKACLCHGDYRSCNIMMKLNENGIEEITPIDYQLMHYGNPVLDFLYLMYSGTDRKFRKDHLINLKELYYETLRTFLKYFQLNVNVVYPREDYDRVFDEKLDFGLMIAIYLLPFLLSSGKKSTRCYAERSSFKFK